MNPAAWEFEIVTLKSGVQSLRSIQNRETFHPVVGPMVEARTLHVQAPRLIERAAGCSGRFVIWDVGLGAAANALALEIAGSAPLAVRAIRRTMRGSLAADVQAATDREHAEQQVLRRTADYREGVAASAERRPPVFTGE